MHIKCYKLCQKPENKTKIMKKKPYSWPNGPNKLLIIMRLDLLRLGHSKINTFTQHSKCSCINAYCMEVEICSDWTKPPSNSNRFQYVCSFVCPRFSSVIFIFNFRICLQSCSLVHSANLTKLVSIYFLTA